MINLIKIAKSFKYAISGIRKVFLEEHNFRVHLLITVIVLLLGIYLQIELMQLMMVVLLIALVLILEIINSILERIVDLLKPRIHQYVQDIKDMTAAVVLIAAGAAAIIGLMIFIPAIINKFY